MPNSKKRTLTRLSIRFPEPLYKALKAESEVTSAPTVILVGQFLAQWG